MADEDAGDWLAPDAPSPIDSDKSDLELDDQSGELGGGSSQPIQKRRRVTRACDECRRKVGNCALSTPAPNLRREADHVIYLQKIKCDGKQPCTHCSVYSYECTYDKPSNRRRNPAPQYIEALESRLQRAENLLRRFMPDVDLAGADLDPAVQQEFRKREQARSSQAGKSRGTGQQPDKDANDAQLMSMIDSIGQLDLDDKGGWDFHGISSGAVFFRRMKEHFRGLLGPPTNWPFLPRAERIPGLINLDSPSPAPTSPYSAVPANYAELPPKDVARNLCYYSLSCATCLFRIVHLPTFYEKFDAIYDKPLDSMSREETRFLALAHAVLALGCMYHSLDDKSSEKMVFKVAAEEGFKYYSTSRALLQDITECRDLTSLQALLFLILYLQATANLSTCYAFIGIALRSAMRIGLHRNLPHEHIDAIEQETRSRLFYVIRQMDTYVSTLLGFPLLLNVDDIDQRYPTEVDDQYITANGIISPPPGTPSFFEAFNAHSRLMDIMAKIMKHVYPMRGVGQSVMKGDKATSTYMISYNRIKEIESDLREWYEKLPQAWRPSSEGPVEVIRVRHLLRFAYAHVQLILYRPFLHYISPRLGQGIKSNEMAYACAAAAISVSRNIVHIGLEIRKQRVLSGPYWFMLYTEFFAVLSLVFYAIENPERPGTSEVLADARAGQQMIADLADKTQSADRVTSALKILFDQLPESLEARPRPASNKKRPVPRPKHGSAAAPQATMATNMAPQRPEDFMRSRAGILPSSSFGTPNSRESIDSAMQTSAAENPFHDPSFTASMQDLMSIDLPSRGTPDSTSTKASSHQQAYPTHAISSQHSVNKLDALMFPSEDPFAYPNQPMMELGYQPKGDGPSGSMISPDPDSQFFMTGSLDDFDAQLLGQPPPYAMQAPPHSDAGMTMSPGMYDPSGFMAMPSGSSSQKQPQQAPPPAQAQAPPLPQRTLQPHRGHTGPHRRAQVQRIRDRHVDQLFTEQGMQPDWGSFFGSGRGGFQGL